jgi:hypothetical protein
MTDATFLRWADRLMERIPRHDWPDLTGEWWAGIRGLVGELKPTDSELVLLLDQIQRNPPRGLDGLLPRIAEELLASRAARDTGPDDRKRAEAESRDCPECGGCAASYYCHRCPMGRWLKAAHLRDPKGPRMADLADHPELHGHPSDSIDPEMVRLFQARRRAAVEAAERKAGSPGRATTPAF